MTTTEFFGMSAYWDFIASVFFSAAKVHGKATWNGETRVVTDLIDMIYCDQVAVVYPERGVVMLTQNELLGVEVEYAGTGWIGECDACGRWYIESRPRSLRVSSYCGCEDERCPDDDGDGDEYDPDL